MLSANVAACDGEVFMCHAADECTQRGEAGMCIGGSCAYPDDACASGWRYAMGTGNALAGNCVDATDVDGTAMEVGTGSTGTPMPPASTSSGSTSDDAGSDETTGDRDPSGDASTTPLPSTDALESTGAYDPTDASSTTGPNAVCDALDCASCFACVVEPGQACAMLEDDCDDATDCAASATCMWGCAIKGLCFDDCCSGVPSEAASTAHDLHACRAEACATACPDLPQPFCAE